ncbi:CAH2, partial [Drosophila busckii]
STVVTAQDFGYGGRHGPEHWGEEYKRCSGKYQSPINIDEMSVVKKRFPEFNYYNWNRTPKSVRLTNNGHTVLVTMTYHQNKEPQVLHGPLQTESPYQFEQFHFHWGENDTIGSEDTINNRAYPAELHVVMRSLAYTNFSEALGKDHGIAVLAFFFKVTQADNPNYSDFTELLTSIKNKDQSVDMDIAKPLSNFVSKNLENYYTYVGSLTTPPCAEEVVWVDYEIPIEISENQLEYFRLLTASDDHLKNNFRPTQPLNNRTVYKHDPFSLEKSDMGAVPFVNADNAA